MDDKTIKELLQAMNTQATMNTRYMEITAEQSKNAHKISQNIMKMTLTIILFAFISFTACNMYLTYKMYDYNYSSFINENINENKNTNDSGGEL